MNRTVMAMDTHPGMYRGSAVLAFDVQMQRIWDVDHNPNGNHARWTLRENALRELTQGVNLVILRTPYGAVLADNEEEKLLDFFLRIDYELSKIVHSPQASLYLRTVYLKRRRV